MVAYDAFTQIFSNPLLSRHIYGPETFTLYGIALIEESLGCRSAASVCSVGLII